MERKMRSLSKRIRSISNCTARSSFFTSPYLLPYLPHQKFPKTVRYILLMGETGSGKSTFINYLANYFLEGTIKSPKTIIPTKWNSKPTVPGYASHSEFNIDDPSSSQTQKCTKYKFSKDDLIYYFIDTPGFSDTASSDNVYVDDHITTTILTAASQLKELHAIILVVNGSVSKSTVSTKTTLQKIAGNFPDVLSNNMLVVYTRTPVKSALSFNEKLIFRTPKKSFYMENIAFTSSSSQWTMDDRRNQAKLWKKSMKEMGNIVDTISQMKPCMTEVFENMLACRNSIKNELMRAINQYERQQFLHEELETLGFEENEIQLKMGQDSVKLQDSGKELSFYDSKQRENMTARLLAEKEQKLERNSKLLNALKQKCSNHLDEENRMKQEIEKTLGKKREIELALSQTKQRKAECETRRSGIQTELQEIQEYLSDAMAIMVAKCRDLKAICSHFDFAAELNATKESYRISLFTLRNEKARQNADTFIQTLGRLAEDMNRQFI